MSPVVSVADWRVHVKAQPCLLEGDMQEISKDEKGRPLAADGWPVSGLARVSEVCAASGLSRSKIYMEIREGRLDTKCFGRSRRVPWSEVRRLFLADTGLRGAVGTPRD